MPSLARKLLICAAVDGLVIQPLATKGQQAQAQQQRPSQPVKIKYGDGAVSSTPRDQVPDVASKPGSSFEAFGIIGFFTVSRLSYLISITGREQVAQVRGFPVYVVTDVALTPCTNQAEAEEAVAHTATQLRRAAAAGRKSVSPADTESDTESEVGGGGEPPPDPGLQSDHDDTASEETKDGKKSSIAEDVIKNRGSYGRFAEKWFSRKGWRIDQKRNLLLSSTDEEDAQTNADTGAGAGAGADTTPAATSTSSQGQGADDDKDLSKTVVKEKVDVPPAPSAGESLLPKLLRMAHIWFGTSRSFYFSYDVDITRNLSSRPAAAVDSAPPPLHKSADPTFFWNRVLLKPFFHTADAEPLLLPIMQGFVGQRSFVVDRDPPQQLDSQQDSVELSDMASGSTSVGGSPGAEDGPATTAATKLRPSEKEFLITVISRRSTKRAGLRYLRRGVDDEGYAANFVETEQLLSAAQDPSSSSSRTYSFVQVRGSIPLFFTQSPYSLKPLPVLQHSAEANFCAFQNHFDHMRKAYGPSVQLVNLVERRGVEAVIGNEYEKNAEKYNQEAAAAATAEGGSSKEQNPPLAFEWFDFHSACRGMKFENVSLLLDTLGQTIDEAGSTVEEGGGIVRRQGGVLRTNCMDCLDRTNVCQSSFARFVLDLQLKAEGFDPAVQSDQQNDVWFNTLWADNGDAISKQYASTAAMKGDYTRTRKRDYRGMVNDLGLSLTRFYNGMVNDYFSQAAIDFFLGNVTSMVFDEFEATMMTKDPAISVGRMRGQAIETSRKIAVENPDREAFVGGWTLLSPPSSGGEPDAVRVRTTGPLEEVVLLLTDAALYLCRFDWNLDKVRSFERVALDHVVGLRVGAYVTATLSPADADEARNVGLVVAYEPGSRDVVRTNTRSLSNVVDPSSSPSSGQEQQQQQESSPSSSSGTLKQGILSAIVPGGNNSSSKSSAGGNGGNQKNQKKQQQQQRRIIALKAPYARTSISDAHEHEHAAEGQGEGENTKAKPLTEGEQIDTIASEIERLVLSINKERDSYDQNDENNNDNRSGDNDNADKASSRQPQEGEGERGGYQDQDQDQGEQRKAVVESIIERGDIISLADAKKSTGLLEQWGHSIKKFVWA
ncbi:hypothetical protein SLS62_007167 [Diatrype stigma]|uniref:Uncharacterized protein n=1 Tax=Diatrype stigma TaxID=117547 RepID=A0AAN9YR21_9PEZI